MTNSILTSPLTLHPATAQFRFRLTPDQANQLLDLLQAMVNPWGDSGTNFVAYKRNEFAVELTTEIPQEHWFTAPGLSNCKLLFSSDRGFELLFQTGSKEGAARLDAANRELREARWQRNG